MTDEKTIDELLEEVRDRAAGYGMAYGLKETADDNLKGTYAMLYASVPEECKTVPERDAWIRRHPVYKDAIEEKLEAYAHWKTCEIFIKLLFARVDVYRTDAATARQLDKLHL